MRQRHVMAQARRVCELPPALLARVRPVAAVRPLVRLEVVDVRESLAARVAHERLVGAVDRQMLVTRALQREAATAHRARVRSHAGVVLLMLLQLTVVAETALADLAWKQHDGITRPAARQT